MRVVRDERGLETLERSCQISCERTGMLKEAEILFEEDAREQTQRRGWAAHAANVAFNLAAGLPLGIAFHRWTSAGVSIGSGILLGEIILWSQPSNLHKWMPSVSFSDSEVLTSWTF